MTTERSGMSLQDATRIVAQACCNIEPAWAAWLVLHEHLSRDAVVTDFPMGAIENGRVFADRVENTDLSSIAGDLHLCVDWHEFRRCFEHLANWALNESFAARHAAVPDSMPEDYSDTQEEVGYRNGWNACREAMLAQRDGGTK